VEIGSLAFSLPGGIAAELDDEACNNRKQGFFSVRRRNPFR
jgi:hypothetical protein